MKKREGAFPSFESKASALFSLSAVPRALGVFLFFAPEMKGARRAGNRFHPDESRRF